MLRKIRRRVIRAALISWQFLRSLQYRLLSENWPRTGPVLHQPIQCIGAGTIALDGRVCFGVFPSPLFLTTYGYLEARNPSAKISIGAGTQINNNFCAIAEHSEILIGKDCLIGLNVEIIDSDFHGLHPAQRGTSLAEWTRPVHIGDNVFIGSHSKILKGVSIGDDAIVAAGSVVSIDVPSRWIAGGNPAKLLKSLG
jgi:maltose O-acetyltransferase